MEGVETKIIKTAYSSAAGTAYITFEDAKVNRNHFTFRTLCGSLNPLPAGPSGYDHGKGGPGLQNDHG